MGRILCCLHLMLPLTGNVPLISAIYDTSSRVTVAVTTSTEGQLSKGQVLLEMEGIPSSQITGTPDAGKVRHEFSIVH